MPFALGAYQCPHGIYKDLLLKVFGSKGPECAFEVSGAFGFGEGAGSACLGPVFFPVTSGPVLSLLRQCDLTSHPGFCLPPVM